MKRVRPIIGQPMVGRCDGTSAIVEDEGYIFLFNPNYRVITAEFRLDASIGLSNGDAFTLRELYPEEGRYIAAPGKGLWDYGDEVAFEMGGISAVVLKIEPAQPKRAQPILFGAVGKVRASRGALTLSGISGRVGDTRALTVLLPGEQAIKKVTVNGHKTAFRQAGSRVTCNVAFEGDLFTKAQ